MKLAAILAVVILSAPAFAQSPRSAEPQLGRNYNNIPFAYDLVARLKVQPQVRVLDAEKQAGVKACENEMMRELRRSGLAENGKAVYRACVEKLGVPDAAPALPGIQPAQ